MIIKKKNRTFEEDSILITSIAGYCCCCVIIIVSLFEIFICETNVFITILTAISTLILLWVTIELVVCFFRSENQCKKDKKQLEDKNKK